jgi:CRP-like cAMP-binding protein
MDSGVSGPKNRLLAALPSEDLLCLRAELETVLLAGGSVMYDVDEPLVRVYFMTAGVASLMTALKDRVTVGVATVGREGAVGVAPLLLGGDTALGRVRVLVPGSALAMEVSTFQSALRKSPTLRAACAAYTRTLLVQILQAVPCNRLHTAEQRCALWLLMCADRTEVETFELATDGLTQMLGVPQSTLTVVGRKLEADGLIRYSRSAITVVDRRGLETAACECYRIVRCKELAATCSRYLTTTIGSCRTRSRPASRFGGQSRSIAEQISTAFSVCVLTVQAGWSVRPYRRR